MLRTLLVLLPIGLLSVVLFSCSDDNPRRQRLSPAEQAQQLKEALDLNDEQTAEVEKIYNESRAEMDKLRDEFSGDRSKMSEMLMENRKKVDTRITEMLTDEQKEKYAVYLEERRERMQERRERDRSRD
jgi:Spy/CpxP family protein refolding chaperone